MSKIEFIFVTVQAGLSKSEKAKTRHERVAKNGEWMTMYAQARPSRKREISLLFHPSDETFGRKVWKLNSILAGEASAKFSLVLEDIAVIDCRVSQFPQIGDVDAATTDLLRVMSGNL